MDLKTDSRIISESGGLRKFLTTPSCGRDAILDYVKKRITLGNKSVILCFRGNAATLYYRGEMLLKITYLPRLKEVRGEFDFRHSRFSPDYREKQALLTSYGVRFKQNDPCYNSLIRFTVSGENEVDGENIAKILDIYCALIDEFLSEELTRHQYDVPSVKRKKMPHIERNVQQRLFSERFYETDGVTYYDIEYAEHRSTDKSVHGRFDLLGLERSGDGYNLVFTELKSTKKACTGNSGVKDHLDDYLGYCNGNEKMLETRKREAVSAMRLFHEILGKPYPENLSESNVTGVKIRFLFTGEAIAYKDAVPQSDGIEVEIREDL